MHTLLDVLKQDLVPLIMKSKDHYPQEKTKRDWINER